MPPRQSETPKSKKFINVEGHCVIELSPKGYWTIHLTYDRCKSHPYTLKYPEHRDKPLPIKVGVSPDASREVPPVPEKRSWIAVIIQVCWVDLLN